jgi:hypothetical protein
MTSQEQSQAFVNRVLAESTILGGPQVLPYGTQISPHIKVGVDEVASPDTGQVLLLAPLVALFETAREELGEPILIDAGFRTVAHELQLEGEGYKTTQFISPHCIGAALDLKLLSKADPTLENGALQDALVKAALQHEFPRPRLGHREYGEKFTHVDLVFLLFQPYGNLDLAELLTGIEGAEQIAIDWKPGVEW